MAKDWPKSPRQEQVLRLLSGGMSEKEVAAKLRLSPHTVHVYVKALYRHFGVASRAELLVRAIEASRQDAGATEQEEKLNVGPIEIYVDPGDASKETLQELFEALSDLRIASGGLGLIFRTDDHCVFSVEGVEQ